MTLADFLRARLDEDEDYARTMMAVGEDGAKKTLPPGREDSLKALMFEMVTDPRALALIGRWTKSGAKPPNDLTRVLREVEAKRKILDDYEKLLAERKAVAGGLLALHGVVRRLATISSDHPDYDPSPGRSSPCLPRQPPQVPHRHMRLLHHVNGRDVSGGQHLPGRGRGVFVKQQEE